MCIAYGNGRKEKNGNGKKKKTEKERKILFKPGVWGVNYPEHSEQQSRQQQAAVREIEFERNGDRGAYNRSRQCEPTTMATVTEVLTDEIALVVNCKIGSCSKSNLIIDS